MGISNCFRTRIEWVRAVVSVACCSFGKAMLCSTAYLGIGQDGAFHILPTGQDQYINVIANCNCCNPTTDSPLPNTCVQECHKIGIEFIDPEAPEGDSSLTSESASAKHAVSSTVRDNPERLRRSLWRQPSWHGDHIRLPFLQTTSRWRHAGTTR